MEFVLIRHTRCDIGAGTCYGRMDVPLVDGAPEDIERTLAQTPPVDSVVCSPAQRCHRLALALGGRDGCEVRVEPALQELDFGAWEGLRWNEIPRALSDEWAADPWRRAPPEGETERELWTRTARAAEEMLRMTTTSRIAVVSHGGPLRILRCLLTQQPLSERWSWNIACGEVVRIECLASLTFTAPPGSIFPSLDP